MWLSPEISRSSMTPSLAYGSCLDAVILLLNPAGEQGEEGLVASVADQVERALAVSAPESRIGPVAEQHLDVPAVAVLLQDHMQGGEPLRVLEVDVGPVLQQPLDGREAAPLDRSHGTGLVLGHRVQARAVADQQIDGLHVLGESRRPQGIL